MPSSLFQTVKRRHYLGAQEQDDTRHIEGQVDNMGGNGSYMLPRA